MISVERSTEEAQNRFELWSNLTTQLGAENVAEVGVWRGEFAEHLLKSCQSIMEYSMIDPWRHLVDWNKPFNVSDDQFDEVKAEALRRTAFAAERRRILQGTTVEVAAKLQDKSIDLCYVDGDHTLHGIIIDLVRIYPKVRDGGILGGDDFLPSAWQHNQQYEPTLVFPAAVIFAEATGSIIYGLPYHQFAIIVDRSRDAFEFRDLTGRYRRPSLREVLRLESTPGFHEIIRRVQSKVFSGRQSNEQKADKENKVK